MVNSVSQFVNKQTSQSKYALNACLDEKALIVPTVRSGYHWRQQPLP
jgi:hypothetical protein